MRIGAVWDRAAGRCPASSAFRRWCTRPSAAKRSTPALRRQRPRHDLCARLRPAIALLQTAERLRHRVYNVASGRPTTHREISAAIQRVIPEARLELLTAITLRSTTRLTWTSPA